MTPSELAAIKFRNAQRRQRKQAAPSGPWVATEGAVRQDGPLGLVIASCRPLDSWGHGRASDTAHFIAGAYNDPVEADVAALITEVERLQGLPGRAQAVAPLAAGTPTLPWFLALEPAQQAAIWTTLAAMLRWSGWLVASRLGGGASAAQFFAALREAGATWEELT